MAEKKESLIKRLESTANTFEAKGKRHWAYGKNDKGGEYFKSARENFDKANKYREKATELKKNSK